MPAERPEALEDDDSAPTRSYVEALLHGHLSPEQLDSLRAEIAGGVMEGALELVRSSPPPRSSGFPGPPSAPVPLWQPIGWSRPPSTPPASASWPSPHEHAPLDLDGDHERASARSYRPAPPLPVEEYEDLGESNLATVHVVSDEETADLRESPWGVYEELVDETHLAALGGVLSVPHLVVAIDRVASLPLEPQAAFVLSRIDGESSVEDVIDMSGLARRDTLRILHELLEQGIIEVVD